MNNMKKPYINPSIEVVLLQASNSILAGSVGVSSTGYDSGTNGGIRSRGYDFDSEYEY